MNARFFGPDGAEINQEDLFKHGLIGVDLDGTLAYYDKWRGETHIGKPIPAMVERVQKWIEMGKDVVIFTARVAEPDPDIRYNICNAISNWCLKYIGEYLPITNTKDYRMVELWDDRAVSVETNTGRVIGRRS